MVRLTGSGISCPDWPLCYGLWFPTPEKLAVLPEVNYTFGQVMSEWFHRFNAAIAVGPLTLVLLVLAYRLRAVVRGLFPTMVTASVVLLIEAGLGGFTVLDSNSPWSVAVHLTVALILIGLVMRAHLLVRQRPDSACPSAPPARTRGAPPGRNPRKTRRQCQDADTELRQPHSHRG